MRFPAFALFALTVIAASAQDHWARRMGAWSNDAFNDVAIDTDGYLYAVGEFGGNFELGNTDLVSQGSLDAVVAKYDPQGNVVWAQTFGGSGMDRAIKVALTDDGGIAVVGQFMGTAAFGPQQLISQGGTQDVFVMKLSQSDGAVTWVRQGGSADGVDQPNGVSVGPDGSIAVAGEFRGHAVFDQGALTSVTDPDENEPSVDIFLATYAGDGSPLWLVHGAAEFADRGMDVVHDGDGNLYLTGQFTDTLTLAGNVHTNAMYSAVFIARFDPAGEEAWFRVFGGGTYNQVFEVAMVQDSILALVGDVQGTVIFLDSDPDLFTVAEPRSSFLLKVGLDGELIAQTTWGSEHPLSTRAISVQGDDIAVLGRFHCQLTGYTAQYGESSFLATGPWDLYVARFQWSDLQFKQAQQFGGSRDKQPGGIVHSPDGAPIFSGSFDRVLIFPSDGDLQASPPVNILVPAQPAVYCNDEHYNIYSGLNGSALKDGFIARGYTEGREPYDVFRRNAGPCIRDFVHPVVLYYGAGAIGPDSIEACGQAYLVGYTGTAFNPDTAVRHSAPELEFLWSTGSTAAAIGATQTGWYTLRVSIASGCWERVDSMHVTVHPPPAVPLINDDVVVNTDAAPAQPIVVCQPEQPWLWVTGLGIGDSIHWQGPPELGAVGNDSIQAVVPGMYTAITLSPEGCVQMNNVLVQIDPSAPMPPLDVLLRLVFPEDLDLNDSLEICEGEPVTLSVEPLLTLLGDSVGMPYAVVGYHRCSPNGVWLPNAPFQAGFACSVNPLQDGWYGWHVQLALTNAPCGVDTIFAEGADSIYVEVFEVAEVQLSVEGPSFICPGDTAMLVGACEGCETAVWSGPGIVQSNDTVVWVNAEGAYTYSGFLTDPNGCAAFGGTGLYVHWNPLPSLFVDPLDGIICPNDSAAIWTSSPGIDFQWFGPLGPMNIDNDTIYTSQQGFYYLEMVDTAGCQLTSDPILVTDYATPFLNVLPDNVLCEPGETSTLYVVTTSESTLLWEAPFAGSTALQQVVSQPGIYTCTVHACDITTVLSTEIFGNTASAQLVEPGPFALCPGQEVDLIAEPGQAIYYWEPGPIFSQQITVDTAGIYLLVVSDANGCQDSLWTGVSIIPTEGFDLGNDTLICPDGSVTLNAPPGFSDPHWSDGSTGDQLVVTDDGDVWLTAEAANGCPVTDTLNVAIYAFPQPLIAEDLIMCVGDTGYLVASGSGAIAWFADLTLTVLVTQGDTLVLIQPPAGMVNYYVTQSDGNCSSLPIEVELIVKPRPQGVTLTGPDTSCPGEQLSFVMSGPPSITAVWTTPMGTLSGNSVVLDPVTESHEGTYVLVPYYGICSGEPLSIDLDVFDPEPPYLGPDTVLCEGDLLHVGLPSGYTNVQWSNGANGLATALIGSGEHYVFAFDAHGCVVSDTLLISTVDCDPIIPNVVTPNGDGVNDGWTITGPYTSADLEVYNRWGQRVWHSDIINTAFKGRHEDNDEPLPEGTYYFVLSLLRNDGRAGTHTGYLTLLR